MDINERVDRIETKIENLENKFNDSIPEIQSGIREIKVMLQERPIQENTDEILRLQCICFSIQDILFIINLINKNKKIFSNLDKYSFFIKTNWKAEMRRS